MKLRRELLLAFAIALAVRAAAAGRAESIYPDGVIELTQARAFAEARWSDGLAPGFHPLYSLLLGGLVALGLPLEPAAWVLAAVLSALVAPLCGATAAALWTGRARQAALAAGLLAALQPVLVRLGGQVLAYGPAHAALALALLGAVRASAPAAGRGWAAVAGLGIGLGFLCRSDALATGAGLVLALGASPGQAGARARRVGLACGVAALVMAPYLVAMRVQAGEWRLSLKKRADQLLRLEAGAPAPVDSGATATSLLELARLEELGKETTRIPETAAPGLVGGAVFAARKVRGAANELLLALALLGLVVARKQPGAWAAPLALLGGWAGQALLQASFGYTSRIHCSFAGVLVAPLAGVGLVVACERLARRLRVPLRTVLAPLFAVTTLGLLAAAVKDPGREGRGEERTIGLLLRARAGPAPLAVVGREARVVAWYAGARYLEPFPPGPPREALAAARAAGATWLVVHLRWRGERPRALERALAAEGLGPPALEHATAPEADGLTYGWLAWEL